MPPTILILGATGETGRALLPLLIAHTDAKLVLAGRNAAELERVAGTLPANRVSTLTLDARDPTAVAPAFAGVDLGVVLAPLTDELPRLARAALDAGADLIDIQHSPAKLKALRALDQDVTAAGRHLITDGGFHPGVPALLARAVEDRFDTIHSALVGSVIQFQWRDVNPRPETMREFIDLLDDTEVAQWADGKWRVDSWSSSRAMRRFDFGPPFGGRTCFTMGLEEMRIWAEAHPALREAGFYVGGFNPVVDYGVLPIMFLGRKLAPRLLTGPLSRLLFWGLRNFSRPPFGTLLRLEAEGVAGGSPHHVALSIFHDDGYALTAIPIAATILQWREGTLPPGVRLQALAVEPHRFLADAERMGCRVTWETSAANATQSAVTAST